jgi:PST family polysaccharide transporter
LWVIEGSLATVLFGRIGGSRAVGLFQVSYQIAALPASEIAAPIREPMYSAYARFLTDTPKLRRQFVDGLAVLLVVIAPMSIGIALTADLLTPVALGPQWSDATDLIRLCAIYALLDAVAHYPFNLFIVLNRQRGLVLTFAAVLCVRFVLFVWAGGTWGMNAGLTVLVGTSALGAIVWMGSEARLIGLSVRELLRPLWRTVGETATMAVVILACMDLHAGTASLAANLLKLLSVAACGAAVQIATQALLWTLCGMPDGPESYLLGFVRNAVRRFARFRLGPATG